MFFIYLINRCLLYFSNNRLAIQSKGYRGKIVGRDKSKQSKFYIATTILCRIPKQIESMIPRAVSLTTISDCPKKAHNFLRVIYEKPNKTRESFAVCGRSLQHPVLPDFSIRLIEWLELHRILGVSKVTLYSMENPENVERVLKYYQKTVIIYENKI